MKVRSKLLAVLVAPFLVLLILAYVGVSQRLDVASSAQRVEQLATMAQTDANLAQELQAEAYYSAAYMASGGTKWAAEKDAQRLKTDQARQDYEAAIAKINPAKDSEDLKKAVGAVDDRLKNLETQRRSVDGVETETPTAIKQYSDISKALSDLDTAIAQATDDPNLARGLNTFANLNRLKYTQANEAALLVAASQVGFFPATWPTPARPDATACANATNGCDIYTKITSASSDVVQQTTIYNQAADGTQKQYLRDATAGKNLATIEKQIIETGTVDVARLDASNAVPTDSGFVRWSPKLAVNPQTAKYTALSTEGATGVVAAALDQGTSLKGAGDNIIGTVLANANKLKSDAQQAATLYLVFAIGAIAIALIAAFYVARAVTVPLKKLTTAAYTLSTDKLPALVERLRNPDEASAPLSETLTAIEINSKDEIGQLADAFNSIQHVTVEVAEEQGALLRKGIGDIFINLARRNQTLLDRQIEFIDQLEANEEDPDQLDNLFKLDHLATRMRRNAESLLVLAGAEPPRRRGRPVALADVVRVAIGEVEDFARISLLALDDVTVGGNVAVDLAHLLSELMENATHFSPPDTSVEIVGHRSETGYTLSVSDQGIGMSVDQLAEANNQLARPPLVGLALSRSLGFIVIGRLSARFGVAVKLTASPSGGVSALVTLPGELVSIDGQPMIAPAPEATADELAPAASAVDVV
ncbi:MAG TPA: nitrate- and nitrite sensing domain-containing protein, partial [Acidimicrobiales bacterium]